MRNRLAPFVLFLAATAVAAAPLAPVAVGADTYPRQPGIRITSYSFDYTLTDASNELVVKEGVDVAFTAAGVKTVELDLCKFSAQPRPAQMANGFADPCAEPGPSTGSGQAGGGRAGAAGGKGMTVTAVTTGDQALTWSHENDRVRVNDAASVCRRRYVLVHCQLSRRAGHRHPDC